MPIQLHLYNHKALCTIQDSDKSYRGACICCCSRPKYEDTSNFDQLKQLRGLNLPRNAIAWLQVEKVVVTKADACTSHL